VHKDSIHAGILRPGSESVELRVMFNEESEIRKAFEQGMGPHRQLRVCYEAGPTGYGLARQLQQMGIACAVIAPSLIPKAAGDKVKTDKRAVRRLSSLAGRIGCDRHEVGVTRRELRELLGWSDRQVRSATERLVRLEHLVSTPGGRGRLRRYRLVESFAAAGPQRTEAPAAAGSPSLRPDEGRTSQGMRAGRTPEFARFARSRRAHDSDDDDVDVDAETDRDAQLSFGLPGGGLVLSRRGGRR
jgi:hypothetical protein